MLSSLRNWSGWAAAADPSQWRPPTCRLLTQSLLCYLIFNQSLTSAAAASTSTADQTDLVNSNSSSSSSSSSSVSQAGNNDNHHSSPPATSLPPDFVSSLTPLLSPSAQILLPSSPSYRQYSLRFLGQEGAPNLLAVVLPTTEADVAAAVRFANSRRVPFLATSGQHGPWNPLSKFSGVGISLRNLETKISLVTAAAAAAGESGGNQQSLSQNQPKQQQQQHAIIGGGMSIRDTIKYLWDNQKETTTGLCECVGVVAPGLGGGHGLFQGRYGLGVDQYVSARLVLGSGQVVTASETENPDLWWGVRGAGQNLGIVTELKVKVYDVEPARRGWAWQGFTFGQDRVEDLYGWLNGFVAAKKQAVELVLWSVWAWDGVRKEPVINFMFIYNGPMTQLKNISQEIQKLGPVGTSEGVVAEYPDMAKVFGVSLDDRLCQKGNVNGILRSADVISYEIPALRKAMDLYGSKLKSEPALNSSVIILEGYSMQGVQAVPAESTAYAHREQRLLLAPNIFWPQNNATLDDIAQRWGRDLWKALSGTAQRRTYINYAWGDEGPQALYGYEPWRLQRLRTLKKKYDPQGRFGYYAWAG